MSGPPIDYYSILEIDPKATQQQIRDAYKKAALKHHPDRVASDSPERPLRTKKFQIINDAYYTLSDPTRRSDYDSVRKFHHFSSSSSPDSDSYEDTTHPDSSQNAGGGFPWSAFGFGSKTDRESRSDEQFGSAFEEMLREEGMAEQEQAQRSDKPWGIVGGVSGGALGFIVANFPGAIAGAVAGNRLGAIRDAKGKSVYDVFKELPQADKARLLGELATKIFAHAVSM